METNNTPQPAEQVQTPTQQFHVDFLNAVAALTRIETPLDEFAALSQIIKVCEARKEVIKPDAINQAKEELLRCKRESGRFYYEGHTFSLDKKLIFEFTENPRKYRMKECVQYRQLAAEKDANTNRNKGLSKEMKGIMDAFPLNHPTVKPDRTDFTLKLVE